MRRPKSRRTLVVALTLFVFTNMLAATLLTAALAVALGRLGIVPWDSRPHLLNGILAMLLVSLGIATTLVALLGRRRLRPIEGLIAATHAIAAGDFSVRVNATGPHELRELVQSFNKMAQELGGIETLRSDFVNNFSHEFKTPIVSIRGFAKLLQDDALPREARDEYTQIIIAESERLANLSTVALTLSKLEHQQIIAEKTAFQLDEQIRRVILMLEPQWQRKQLDLQVELDSVTFLGDEELLQQVWLNLIGNAIKFTPPGGRISVALMDTGDTVNIRIADNGIGMNEETKQHLFDKFFQGNKSHSEPGNGLGLSLVKRIVELCAGTIRVKSQVGQGSSFTVELPR